MGKNKTGGAMSIKGMIQNLQVENMEVVQGKVISVNPLKIQVESDEKLVIGANSIYIPQHLTDYTTTVEIADPSSVSVSMATSGNHTHNDGKHDEHVDGDGSHEHSGGDHSHELSINLSKVKMTVSNALKVGDRVHILSFNYGKQYYALGRVV